MDKKITEIEVKIAQKKNGASSLPKSVTNPIYSKFIGFINFKKKFGIKDIFKD